MKSSTGKNRIRRIRAGVLASALLLSCLAGGFEAEAAAAETRLAVTTAAAQTASYLKGTVTEPGCASVGGDWTVFGLARSAAGLPEGYAASYYRRISALIRNTGEELDASKHTENARVVLALTAAEYDPRNVSGRNLLRPLADFEGTVKQGINGTVFALLALDSGDYEMPPAAPGKIQATRQAYVDRILSSRLPDGGWNLRGQGSADIDTTAMALQALARYEDREEVRAAAEGAFACLKMLTPASCESTAQMIIAYTEWGRDPGETLLKELLSCRNADGSFRHLKEDSEGSLMSTEQAFCALTTAQRYYSGSSGLYRCAGDAGTAGQVKTAAHAQTARLRKTAAQTAGEERKLG